MSCAFCHVVQSSHHFLSWFCLSLLAFSARHTSTPWRSLLALSSSKGSRGQCGHVKPCCTEGLVARVAAGQRMLQSLQNCCSVYLANKLIPSCILFSSVVFTSCSVPKGWQLLLFLGAAAHSSLQNIPEWDGNFPEPPPSSLGWPPEGFRNSFFGL